MLPFLMVIDMKCSSRERPWPVAWPEATARDEHDILGRTRSPGPSEARGQVSLTETTRSVVRRPGPSDVGDVRNAAGLLAVESAAEPDVERVVRRR
jgi:hypothetical protein